jgi:hypothetical protein
VSRIVLLQRAPIALACGSLSNSTRSRDSSRSLLWKDSAYPFRRGLPGATYSVPECVPSSHDRTTSAANSGPLSLRCGPDDVSRRLRGLVPFVWLLATVREAL